MPIKHLEYGYSALICGNIGISKISAYGSPKSLSACNRCTVSGYLIPDIFGEMIRLRS